MIEVREELNGKILTINVVRTCEVDEIIDTILKYYCKGYKMVLWNFNKGTISHLTRENFIAMAKAEKSCCENIKSACIGQNDLEFGMLQMYNAYAKNIINHDLKIFRDKNDGMNWLKEYVIAT